MRLLVARDDEEIPQLLRDAWRDSGKTQKHMAEHLGVSTKHMNFVLMGKSRLSLPMLYRLLAYLDIGIIMIPK